MAEYRRIGSMYFFVYSERNHIDDKGAKLLGKAKWANLKIVNLTYNCITHQGAKYILKAEWPSLTNLLISKYQIN